MSCGKPHQKPCSEVLEEVYVYLDGETDDDERARIREHLDECEPCLRQYGLDQAVKALVARSCGCDHVPDDLRGKVMSRIREVRMEISQVEYRPE